MKKLMIRIFSSLSLLALVAPKAFAVWPPSTSLENQATPEMTGNIPIQTASERLQGVVQSLENDERRFSKLLDALEKDEEALKNRTNTEKSAEKRNSGSQENREKK